MKCKNGHEFDFPAYVLQRVRTGNPIAVDKGVDLSRYEIATPVCPICQHPLAMAPASEKKKDVRRKKKEPKPKLQFPPVKKEPEKPKEDDA